MIFRYTHPRRLAYSGAIVIGGEERSQKRRFEAEPLSPVVMEPLAGTR